MTFRPLDVSPQDVSPLYVSQPGRFAHSLDVSPPSAFLCVCCFLVVVVVDLIRSQCTKFHSSSRMRVIYHNWSATKQRPHPQSVAEISHHSVLSGDRIRQCETSSGSRHKDTDQCLLSRHFLLQAQQCPCYMRKRFSRDHCCQGRSKPGCRIVGWHTR